METQVDYSIMLVNMGGPASLSNIQPFLYELFSDKDIIQLPIPFIQPLFASLISKLRAPKVAEHYKKIGGGSPILDITWKQAMAIESKLKQSIKCRVHVAMRYTEPTIDKVIKDIEQDRSKGVVVLPLYPQYSFSTTRSVYNELDRALKKMDTKFPMIRIQDWYDFPDYIKTISSMIKEKLQTCPDQDNVHIVFTAHSIPVSYVKKGDPYENQINECVQKIVEELSCPNPYHLCYQSKVGPVKWLEPSTENMIHQISLGKDQDILMIPISFVSDHIETLYEIDILYHDLAKKVGIRHFYRLDSFNDNSMFINTLSSLILSYINGGGF